MINTLQLIVHVPLFTINFPANAQYMFQFIVSVSQFDIIPTDFIDGILDKFQITSDDAYNDQFESLDIF